MFRLKKIRWIVAHHSATEDGSKETIDNIKEHQREIFGEGSVMNTYHYLISDKGEIVKWISEEYVSGHCGVDGWSNWDKPCNFNSLGICFVGNFEKYKMSEEQFRAGVYLITKLCKKYDIPSENIIGHRDVINTKCPGKYFPLKRLREEVEEMIKGKEVKGSKYGKELLNYFIQKGVITTPEAHKDLTVPFTKEETLALLKNILDRLKVEV